MSRISIACKNLFEILSFATKPLQPQPSPLSKKTNTIAKTIFSTGNGVKALSATDVESIRDKKITDLVSLLPEGKRQGLEILFKKNSLSAQEKINLIIPQIPLFCRFELAIKEALAFSPKEDIHMLCSSRGTLHTYHLPEGSFLLTLILIDLDKKTEGKASDIYYESCSDKYSKIKQQFFELNLNKAGTLSEVDALESILNRPLALGERLLLAIRTAGKISPDKVSIRNFCKKGGPLREFRLQDNEPGLLRLLQQLDAKTAGQASKIYFKKPLKSSSKS